MWDTKIKNTAFWFGDHNARARFFPNTWLWQKVIRPSVLSHSSKTSTFICIIFLSELQKLHCGGIFGTFWASLTRQSFFKNRALSVFLNYDSLTSSIKSRDTDELFLRFFLGNGQNRRRNGQTNGRPAKYTGHFC